MRSNNSSATDRVAIVGAGIAGSAAAYFARVAFGSDLSVVVFEQSAQIGGRIQHRPFAGTIVETGATLMHSSNAQQWPPFRLGRRIYYANAMESAVSTMETEAVAGRNVVGPFETGLLVGL
jgi:flavin-dependent dehydrogenase